MPGNPEPENFSPYIPARAKLRELTLGPLVLGTLLGVVFGASSLYLVLKVGLTVSASIPVAVISITVFRLLSKLGLKNATILENNIVQTAGSAGESIAFGVGVTMPAIMILGFDLEITRVALVAVLGGLLGILMMIPLRRALIVEQHGILKYPEGTACAEVLKAGASDESREAAREAGNTSAEAASGGKTIFAGFGIGLLYKTAMAAFKAWKDTPEKVLGAPLKAGSISAEISPELMGVGYIIGPKISAVMAAGGVLAYLVLIPAIKFFGDGLSAPLAPGTKLISQMDPHEIRSAYVLYIGAGAVAAGGIISLVRSLPTIWQGLKAGLRDLRGTKTDKGVAGAETPRTDRDLSMKFVLIGCIALVTVIVLAKPLGMNLIGALLIIVFGFLFVTVSSRLTGEIGSSSNPISGMTVATLLSTCAFFLILGWTGPPYYVTALSVGAIVCIAASNGGTTSQDLKTGYLIGATPRLQQIAILVGALASALLLGPILLTLNATSTVYVPETYVQKLEEPVSLDAGDVLAAEDWSGTKPAFLAQSGALKRITVAAALPQAPKGKLEPGHYLVDGDRAVAEVILAFPSGLKTDASLLKDKEFIKGPQAKDDGAEYLVWHNDDDEAAPRGKYLVRPDGAVAYLVDPGINGTYVFRPDGSKVAKYDAPKATLMSYIIKGILNRKLPWGLVLLGVMIAVVLELSGIPSLAFAVGVYLPLSSSTPILAGGAIRWLVDRFTKKKFAGKSFTEDDLAAEGDKSPGVLMASGYIAGGAIAGIVIAFMAGVLGDLSDRIETWAKANNPFFAGPNADVLSLGPFLIIGVVLYLVGRELWLKPESAPPSPKL